MQAGEPLPASFPPGMPADMLAVLQAARRIRVYGQGRAPQSYDPGRDAVLLADDILGPDDGASEAARRGQS